MAAGSTKVILIALTANFFIGVAKFVGAAFSGSASLFAEGIHSIVDCSNQGLLLIGGKLSKKPPTAKHPLGFGRENFFWSFVVALLLFSLGGLVALYEGFHKLSHPEPLSQLWIGAVILTFAIVLEGFALKACLKEIARTNRHGSLFRWFRRTTSADLLVIFTEDVAALLGLVTALFCLTMAWITGDSAWDARGSIAIGVLLIIIPIFLVVEVKSLLIGEAPAEDYRGSVEALVKRVIPTGSIIRFIAIQTGSDEVLLAYKINPGDERDGDRMIRMVNEIEEGVKATHPEVRWQFAELDREE